MPADTSVSVRYSFAEALFDDFRREGQTGILFVKTGRRVTLGQDLTVVVEFPVERRTFRLRGQVVSARRGSREPALPGGIEVAFPSGQNHIVQMLLDHASGKQVDFIVRKTKRVLCAVEVNYRTDTGFVREFAEDLSEGGTFIRTDEIFAVGTEIACKLKPPGYLLGVKLRARVAWVSRTKAPKGMGLEFLFDSDRQRKKIRDICRRLAEEHSAKVERSVQAFRKREKE
jgi:uncharacterized protein (TIGR02266 family)